MTAHFVAPPKTGPSREQLIDWAQALADTVAPYAEAAEDLRRLPPQVVEAIVSSGLMPLVRPARYGGYEADWATLADCLMPLGRVSGSITWCAAFLFQHQWILSHFPLEVQDEVYAAHPDPKIVTSFSPNGKVERVDGGYRVTGEWPFGSGGDHCDWAIIGSVAPGRGDAPPSAMWFLFKPGQFHMRDVWRSAGLKGTGSNTIVIEDAFVPEACAVGVAEIMSGRHPGRIVSDQPIYTTGVGSQFQFGLAPPLIAVGEGLYADFLDFTRDKANALTPGKKADDPTTQLRVGESAAELNAARLILRAQSERVMTNAAVGPQTGPAFLRDIGLIARLVHQASDRLFTLSGARGLAEGNRFGRHWRDVHAMCNHVAMQSDGMIRGFGALELTGAPLSVRR